MSEKKFDQSVDVIWFSSHRWTKFQVKWFTKLRWKNWQNKKMRMGTKVRSIISFFKQYYEPINTIFHVFMSTCAVCCCCCCCHSCLMRTFAHYTFRFISKYLICGLLGGQWVYYVSKNVQYTICIFQNHLCFSIWMHFFYFLCSILCLSYYHQFDISHICFNCN